MNVQTNYEVAGRTDWKTPPELFALLDAEFSFTIDAAADDADHLCPRYLTREEDALTKPWLGDNVVFCNPPFADLKPWTQMFVRWATAGATVVALLPSKTDTVWFENVWFGAHEVRFLTPRVQFIAPTTGQPGKNSNNSGSMVAVYRHGVRFHYSDKDVVFVDPPRCIHWRWK